jgi:hypothetical protein
LKQINQHYFKHGKLFTYNQRRKRQKLRFLLTLLNYFVALIGKSFIVYWYIYELNKLNGLDTNGQYNNIAACENFIDAMFLRN